MSQSIDPLKTVKAIDPRVNFNRPDYVIQQGAGSTTYKVFNASTVSATAIQFTCPPPNVNIAVDRKVFIEFSGKLKFTGTAGVGQPLLALGTNDSLRSYPLSKIVNTISVSVNSQSFTTNLSDYADALLHYNNELDTRCYELSGTPSMLDTMQDYRQYVSNSAILTTVDIIPPPVQPPPPQQQLPTTQLVQALGLGSARNTMASYGENSTENARGGFTVVKVLRDIGTEAEVEFTIYEPIFLSPFLFGERNSMGLYGVQTLDITLNLGSPFRMWSHVPAPVGTAITNIEFVPNSSVSSCKAHFCYLTPQINQLLSSDNTYSYPYYKIDRYPTTLGLSIPGQPHPQVSSNNIQFSSIPRRVYVFARKSNAELSNTNLPATRGPARYPWTSTDTYLKINKISVNFNNKAGLLSGADSFDLYHMSVQNGLKTSWDQWSRHQGSVLCLDLARDLSLSPIEAPGVLGTYQFSFTVDLEDVRPKTYDATTGALIADEMQIELYVVAVSEGTMTIKNQQTVAQIGVVAPADVLNDPDIPLVDYYISTRGANFYGGAFTDTLKKYGRKALVGLNAALPALNAAAPFLPGSTLTVPALKLAEKYLPKLIGAGVSEMQARQIVGGGYSEDQIKAYLRQLKGGRSAVGGGVLGGGYGSMGTSASPSSMGGMQASRSRMARHLRN